MDNDTDIDLLIIGGGINGAGIAADASGRGLKVCLCEKDDLGSHTSSASSKLIHGGLRYLEHLEFKLVKESLQEREILLKTAPHLIHPIKFIMPYKYKLRPFWLIRLGLFLYDHLNCGHSLPKAHSLKLPALLEKNPLVPSIKQALSYSDCTVDDSRLVIANALRAQQNGAIILPRTELIEAKPNGDRWSITLKNTLNQQLTTIRAKALINATGPWVNQISNQLNLKSKYKSLLVKGSHIVVPKFYEGEQAYILQNKDRRVIFVIPYHNLYTMIGTTDVAYNGELNSITINDDEVDYLCHSVNHYFHHSLKKEDIIATWSGVRTLVFDKTNNLSSLSREYRLELLKADNLPVINIFGGKLTTYRSLAEKTLKILAPYLPMGPEWTKNTPLPGGDLAYKSFKEFAAHLQETYNFVPNGIIARFARSYGSKAHELLQNCKTAEDLGEYFGHGLYQIEVDYLIKHEWAKTAEDILWRRTHLGLIFTKNATTKLEEYLKTK